MEVYMVNNLIIYSIARSGRSLLIWIVRNV